MTDGSAPDAARAVEEVARAAYGRLVAYLASVTGDLAAAEDALGDAFLAALRTWPERGVPDRPDSWLVTAARRALVDAARRRATAAKALPDLARLAAEQDGPAAVPDKRLELMFACCHPAVEEAMRSPLMLQTVMGLDAARIAAAFLVAPAAMGQRLVRVKTKIKQAGVPFALPGREDLAERVSSVLDAIYAAYGTGWDDPDQPGPGTGGPGTGRPGTGGPGAGGPGTGGSGAGGLVGEAVRLARIVVDLLPAEPEGHGLLALLLHSDARARARRSAGGEFVPLDRQDVALWSRAAMEEAEHHLSLALAARRIGPYQLHAAIQSVHNRRALTGRTDWAAVAALYDGLVVLTPTVGAHVARATARGAADGAAAGLALLDELPADRVAAYQPYWVARAHCLAGTGDGAGAADAARVALGLTADPATRAHLTRRHLSPNGTAP